MLFQPIEINGVNTMFAQPGVESAAGPTFVKSNKIIFTKSIRSTKTKHRMVINRLLHHFIIVLKFVKRILNCKSDCNASCLLTYDTKTPILQLFY